ncbi:MAG: hypothetical protein IT531_08965 [Burkholderiales bacterium]|nr:hypothetical protein [Burkholderiales bacterium]
MRRAVPLAAMTLFMAGSALAAEPDMSSPYDKNPQCAERRADGTAPECVIQSEGAPRVLHPPKATPTPPKPPTPPAPPAPPSAAARANPQGSGASR